MEVFEQDIKRSIEVLQAGGVILFPAETGWFIGCDATQETAVNKLLALKRIGNAGDLIVLMADEREVLQWVAAPDLAVFNFIAAQAIPTVIIFENALGLPGNLVAADGSVAIRLVQDTFCRHLIKRLRKPVAASAAITSGESAPESFSVVEQPITADVDYSVTWRQEALIPFQAAQIIRWNG